jgi:hypothetical protein
MDDRRFYDEREEIKPLTLVCPFCRQQDRYPVRWKVRTRKRSLPRGAAMKTASASRGPVPIWSASTTSSPVATSGAGNGLKLRGRR